jgi:ankyrin repeat protein
LSIRGNPADPALPSPRDRCTALHVAAMANHLQVMKVLFEVVRGRHIRESGQTTTANAAAAAAVVDAFTHATLPHGETALHQAASFGGLETLTYLIDECQAKIDMRRNDGCTPLHLASGKGHLSVVMALLLRGACKTAPDFQRHLTPIHVAARAGCDAVLKELLSYNHTSSDLSQQASAAASAATTSATSSATTSTNEVNIAAKQNFQPLHLAAVGGHAQTCTLLIGLGANINAITSDNHTPLSLACNSLKFEAVEALLEAGARVDTMG